MQSPDKIDFWWANGCELFWTCCKSSDFVHLGSSHFGDVLAIKIPVKKLCTPGDTTLSEPRDPYVVSLRLALYHYKLVYKWILLRNDKNQMLSNDVWHSSEKLPPSPAIHGTILG